MKKAETRLVEGEGSSYKHRKKPRNSMPIEPPQSKYRATCVVSLLLGLFLLCGCATSRIVLDNVQDINIHPFQIVGYYEEDKDGYTTRVIINQSWIEEINKDKYYLEFIIKEPLSKPSL